MAKLREARAIDKLCRQCPRPAVPGRRMCRKHLDDDKARKANSR